MSYAYDNLGRIQKASYSSGRNLHYTYTGDGLVYGCYQNYCYLNAIEPQRDIGKSVASAQVIPQEALDVRNYVDDHNGSPPPGYKGGGTFVNDGRGGGQILPSNGMPYREYDIHPHVAGISRGIERIVIGADGSAWYTNNHYITFTEM